MKEELLSKSQSEDIPKLLSEVDRAALKLGISRRELAKNTAIPFNTLRCWYAKNPKRKPSPAHLKRLLAFLGSVTTTTARSTSQSFLEARNGKGETTLRTQRLKEIMKSLYDELVWFCKNGKEARDILRTELNPFDVGYISSLATMLSEEDKYLRWSAATTYRFNFFRRRGGKR